MQPHVCHMKVIPLAVIQLSSNLCRVRTSLSYYRTYVAKFLIGKSTGKGSLESLRRRLEENIRTNLIEIGVNKRKWIKSAQNRDYCRTLVNDALNLQVP